MKINRFTVGVMQTNSYLVSNDGTKEAVLIDPARGYSRIKDYCKNEGLTITAVLITHGHFDHILEASLWQADNIPVYIHKEDADKLHSDKNLAYMFRASIPPCTADVLLSDGDVIEKAGFKIKVIHTPGHSRGSVCYLIGDNLFSGDTLFDEDYGRVDFPDGDIEDMKASIKKLFALDGDYNVYPGHCESTTLGKERKSNIILREL